MDSRSKVFFIIATFISFGYRFYADYMEEKKKQETRQLLKLGLIVSNRQQHVQSERYN